MRCCSPRVLVCASLIVLASCGGSSTDAHPAADASTPAPDAAPPNAGPDAASDDAGEAPDATESADAAPRNAVCTPTSAQLGTAVNTTHGRLDGTLVYVVPPLGSPDDAGYYENGFGAAADGGDGGFHHHPDGGFDAGPSGSLHQCNGDDSHVHLQVDVDGDVYDIAVDIGAENDQVGMYEQALAPLEGAWAEGWHDDDLSYASLGLHVASFPLGTPTTNAASLGSLLEGTSQISIYCTGYSEGNGCHDVHYQDGSTNDGALVLNPQAATPTLVFFRFVSQTF
jgi:hypothetical protein